MHWIDLAIIVIYSAAVLGVGLFFLRRQQDVEQYLVGDRNIGAWHIGLSVVATDVGGGFSIGLGGLGFVMGLSGSWLLFTGLLGAWLSAVVLIPSVKKLGDQHGWLSFPDFLENRFDGRVRNVAALVSGLGYAGFVGAQVLAGAKLAAVAFNIELNLAVLIMAGIIIAYTSLGGLQAVIYTDTVQWIVLLFGLIFFALPFAYRQIGGMPQLTQALPPQFFSLTNVSFTELTTWLVTIVPIWFVGMTLYQRIYAAKDLATAKRAWFIAGLFEYPVMAFCGVALGLFSRVLFPEAEPEMGLPLLIKNVLPVGVVGLVLAAYFSAIMSTADSCLLAAVGNFVGDLYLKLAPDENKHQRSLNLSRLMTVVIGIASTGLALFFPNVLDVILLAYAFMVSGLFFPTIGGLLWKRVDSRAALASMLAGGSVAVGFSLFPALAPANEPIFLALPVSALTLEVFTLMNRSATAQPR